MILERLCFVTRRPDPVDPGACIHPPPLPRHLPPELIIKNSYQWSGGLQVDRARRLKELERENAKFKRLVSELSLEKLVLKDIAAEPSCQH